MICWAVKLNLLPASVASEAHIAEPVPPKLGSGPTNVIQNPLAFQARALGGKQLFLSYCPAHLNYRRQFRRAFGIHSNLRTPSEEPSNCAGSTHPT